MDRLARVITALSKLARTIPERDRLTHDVLDVLTEDVMSIRAEVLAGRPDRPARNQAEMLLGDNMIVTSTAEYPSGTIQITAKRVDPS